MAQSRQEGRPQRRERDSHTPGWSTPSLEASLHPRVTDSSRGSGPWPDCSLGAPSSADLPVLTHPRLSPCSSSPRPHLETLWDEYPHPGEPASVQSTLLPAPPCLPHCRSVCSDPAGLDDWEQAQKSMSIESMMSSNHLILCRPLLLLPSICPSTRVFSSESALRIRLL